MVSETDADTALNEQAIINGSGRSVVEAAGKTPCPASARLKTGPSGGAWFNTLSPFEHFDSMRTQVFPYTCTAQQIAGSDPVAIVTRTSVGDYPSPYNAMTRNRDELFVYGGYAAQDNGAYVAKLDPATLREAWRVYMRVASDDHFNWPGVAGIHGNGFVYAVAGNLLAKVNPDTAEMLMVRLPEHRGQGGAAYNGFVVSPQGVIFAKSIERGAKCPSDCNSICGLACAAKNDVPSFLVAVDPRDLSFVAQTETREPIIGRIMTDRQDGIDYVYCPGVTSVWRYAFINGALEPDPTWGPVPYITGKEQPGSGCGLLGDWVVVQTNFLRSRAPLVVWAINKWDSNKFHTIRPFPEGAPSQEWSKSGLDVENMRVFTSDQLVGKVTALDFDARRGFTRRWEAAQTMASFWAIVADRGNRQIVGTDYTKKGDHAVWRDAATGKEIARSAPLDKKKNGDIIGPGFDGKFYYMAVNSRKVVEISLVPKS